MSVSDCPCGSTLSFDECCNPYLQGTDFPKTALALMKSRYSAYVKGHIDYIISTHASETRRELDKEATRRWSKESKWEGLDIISVKKGEEGDHIGEVEFVARYYSGGTLIKHRERSFFVKKDQKWYFKDSETIKADTYVRKAPKIGRNDPCTCGSGVKYKKCCFGAKQQVSE